MVTWQQSTHNYVRATVW